jgi:hypothetical protein
VFNVTVVRRRSACASHYPSHARIPFFSCLQIAPSGGSFISLKYEAYMLTEEREHVCILVGCCAQTEKVCLDRLCLDVDNGYFDFSGTWALDNRLFKAY